MDVDIIRPNAKAIAIGANKLLLDNIKGKSPIIVVKVDKSIGLNLVTDASTHALSISLHSCLFFLF